MSGDISSFTFFCFPAEIRFRIYEYVFDGSEVAYDQRSVEGEQVAVFNPTATSGHRNILQASKACRSEALPIYHRISSLKLMEGEWSLSDIPADLPRALVQHLTELRLSPFDRVSIEDALVARATFQSLRLIKVNTFDELVWGPEIFDDADLWTELDMQPALTQVLPGFKIGNSIGGIHVQGEIYIVSACVTCDECDGCDNVSDHVLLVDYSTRTILSG